MRMILVAIVISTFAITACRSKKQVAEQPKPVADASELATAQALQKLKNRAEAPEWVQIIADVSVTQNGSTNNGVADVRLHQGEKVWVEISDPIVGIKAIRAIALDDSVAYQNRIEGNYFAGPYTWVERKLGTSIPFQYIFNVFQAEPFTLEGILKAENEQYKLAADLDKSLKYTANFEAHSLDLFAQSLLTPRDYIEITYANYKTVNGYRFPQSIVIVVGGSQQLKAVFAVREIKTGKPLNMQFNLNTKYERIQ